jgi:hypothetical protein
MNGHEEWKGDTNGERKSGETNGKLEDGLNALFKLLWQSLPPRATHLPDG